MNRQKGWAWDRDQWVGQGLSASGTPRDSEPEIARWDSAQWVGEGQGGVTGIAPITSLAHASEPTGFSGFGVSDSGGQQWAPSAAAGSGSIESPARALAA